MESQDTLTLYLLKLWPAVEANKNRIIGGAAVVLLAILAVLFLSWHKEQQEINAGEAFSQMITSLRPNTSPASLADNYFKIAGDYSGTLAAQRALLQGASTYFSAARYADAQIQFQKFADTYPQSTLLPVALFGLAACQDAQGNLNAAADAYKNVVNTYGTAATAIPAKYALAGIYVRQGKLKDAITYFQEIARTAQGSTMGQQAAEQAVELSTQIPAPAAMPAPVMSAPAMTAPAMTPAK